MADKNATIDVMDKVVYASPKKYLIIDVKNLLAENAISVSSIRLNLFAEVLGGHWRGETWADTTIDDSRELAVPIEDFTDKLNDSQTFEIYVDEQRYGEAEGLIEKYFEDNAFKYAIFKSRDYDEVDEVRRLLSKNDIHCDEIEAIYLEDRSEGYLLFLDPAFHATAEKIIDTENKLREKMDSRPTTGSKKAIFYEGEMDQRNPLLGGMAFVLILVIVGLVLYSLREKFPVLGKIWEFLRNLGGLGGR